MLSKYNHLPDYFHDLKTILQSEFNLLKKATSKNIENLQEAIQSQQAYTTALCGHVNSFYTKLAQLDWQVQMHCLYPHPQSDAPEYDLDIDGQPDPVTDILSPVALHTASTTQQSLNAENIKEDTVPDTVNSEQHTTPSPDTNRPKSQPPPVLDDTDHPGYQDAKQPRAKHLSDYRPQLEDIPELEDDEENWKKANSWMLISSIITTPLRKVTEYVTSTLHILRKLQNRNTVLTIA